MSISEQCDMVLLALYEYMQKITKKDFDYVILVALQTYINQARILKNVDRKKSEETLLHAMAIVRATEDAKRAS